MSNTRGRGGGLVHEAKTLHFLRENVILEKKYNTKKIRHNSIVIRTSFGKNRREKT